MISDLELGQRRPRSGTLICLAVALGGDAAALTDRLVELAGFSLADDTAASVQARARRFRRARLYEAKLARSKPRGKPAPPSA